MDILSIIAERKIQAALRSGELDDNPLRGKPLPADDDWMRAPVALRMSLKLLKNAGFVPEEVTLRKRLDELVGLIEDEGDDGAADALRIELRQKEMRLKLLLERQGMTANAAATVARALETKRAREGGASDG